ncbi:MFS transporter [Microbacterium sp. QXD-8]|uniref:MFS transporter n=1 Tax=Microbacterium psychrotolerans TaxID=3068321 RepID=A0ABU0YYK3_9MICO|nr:MFS transporter [Microbacterium sp. QXD-8]MDQ7877416.1 MFS transporter [Microbacterium sp. QXD-8]
MADIAAGTSAGTDPVRALAPLTVPIFRALWIAALVSNIGSWMQTVGAQWFMVEQNSSPLLIALVQTASAAPVLLLGIPAGVLGELLNRRRLLIWVQSAQVLISAGLVALTAAGEMTPYLLLVLTLLLGAASAVQLPAYGAISAEIVPTRMIPNAASLSAISVNLARAIGPAIAGLLLFRLGVAFVFALNLISFAVFLLVLIGWRTYRPDPHEPEGFLAATRAGVRYVAHSGVVRRIYVRLGSFVVPGSVLYALLPLIATDQLGLGSTGYGVLLAGLGVGSVAAAFLAPVVRDRIGPNRTVFISSAVFGAGTLAVALSPVIAVTLPVLAVVGAAWIGVVATLNGAVEAFLPVWVRARGLSIYQMVLFGSLAVGAAVSGVIALWIGTVPTAAGAGVLVIIVAATQLAWPLLSTAEKKRPTAPLPLAENQGADIDMERQTLVLVWYDVTAANRPAFMDQITLVERSRRRTGARTWALYQDRESPQDVVEVFSVGSWQEHLQQHATRPTQYDDETIRASSEIADSIAVHHLVQIDPDQTPRASSSTHRRQHKKQEKPA